MDRDSSIHGVQSYDYGPVEIAEEVGWDAYKKVADNFMLMLKSTGLHHGYSFNTWSDMVTYDEEFINEWLRSPQTSMYYALQVMSTTQDKTDVHAALGDLDVDEYLEGILSDKPDSDPITCDCQE